ncbi:MAG: ABC transporter permease [Candidatus Omnitrophica bacterium]|nr:ABC transporter permease [Candidatus Omnitrophota bacterium]
MLNYLKNFFLYRDVLISLTIKYLKVKYKMAFLGFLWAILHPLSMMVVLSIVFSFIVRIEVEKFPIFLLCGLLPWSFTSVALISTTSSIVDNSNLIKKIFFPRLAIPISVILSNMVHFLFSLVILIVFLLIFNVNFTVHMFLIPVIIIIHFLFVTGISLISSVFYVWYRDVKYIIEVGLLLWFYFTPIFYPISFVPKEFQWLYVLNPMAGIIKMYRNVLLYGKGLEMKFLVCSFLVSVFVFILGLVIFKKKENEFADIV